MRKLQTKSTPARIRNSIFAAMHSAGEFYKMSRDVPSIVRELVRESGKTTHRDIPKPVWLRRGFCEWLTNWCAEFASDPECVEKLAAVLEMAWYGQLANPERLAPGWLIDWPGEVEQQVLLAAPERLDAASTWQIETAIRAQVKSASVAGKKRKPSGEVTSPDPVPVVGFRHGPDFAWVEETDGERISLTLRQSHVFVMLAAAGEPFELPHATILAKLNSPDSSLRDTFRHCKLWKSLIVSDGKKRTVRLTSPPIQD